MVHGAGQALGQQGIPFGHAAIDVGHDRIAETGQGFRCALVPERKLQRQRDGDHVRMLVQQMRDSGTQLDGTLTGVGEAALGGDPQDGVGGAQDAGADLEELHRAAPCARLQPEHADAPQDVVAAERVSLHGGVAAAAREGARLQQHAHHRVPPGWMVGIDDDALVGIERWHAAMGQSDTVEVPPGMAAHIGCHEPGYKAGAGCQDGGGVAGIGFAHAPRRFIGRHGQALTGRLERVS
jgi:hypothetical protein